jgi:hypothetical protein
MERSEGVVRVAALAGLTLVGYSLMCWILNFTGAAAPVTQPEKVLSSQPTEGGVLERIEASDGATGRRVFKDSAGRTVREIFYVPDRSPFSVKAGETESLRECRTRVLQYDEAGRLVLDAQYNGQRTLIYYSEHSYWPEGGNRLSCYFTAAGIRRGETRYPRKGKPTTLQFDSATGKRLLYFSGPVPDDVDLADGWGPQTGALRYGITVSDHFISCTIKNVSETGSSLAQDTIGRLIRPDLRDAEGKVVPYKKDAVANLSRVQHHGPNSLAPNHASYEYCLLGDWYGKLPPGRYSLLLRRRGTGRDFDLTSNTVQFVVEVPVALHAAALDERIRQVTVRRSMTSWMDVVATPLSKSQLHQVVPGALARYDLSDLVRAIAQRPVHILEPLDPAGNPVGAAAP